MKDLINNLLDSFPELKLVNDISLYHYTNLSGFKGIVESKELWFTNAGFLNDEQEIAFASDLIYKGLEKRLDETNRKSYLYDLFLDVTSFPSNILGQSVVYTFSFSTSLDDLSQWRGYTDSTGVSMEFKNEFSFMNISPYSFPVIYDPSLQNSLIVKSIDLVIDFFEKYFDQKIQINKASLSGFSSSIERESFLNICRTCGSFFLFLSSIIKLEIFSSEKEIRFFVFNQDQRNVKFRERNSILIPYLNLELLNLNNFTSLYLAPWSRDKLIKKSIDYFLDCRGFKISSESKLKIRN